jgi:hypothetical protein
MYNALTVQVKSDQILLPGNATSMIGLCQEAQDPPDALGRSAGVNSLPFSARGVGPSAAVSIRE